MDEYKAEIGINGGGSFYLGEANNQLFNYTRPAFSGYVRYLFSPRIALRAELSSAIVAGSAIKDNQIYIGDLCGEFNFFDLEQNPYKRYSKTFSPYIFAGLGMITDVYAGQNLPEACLPFGIGMKFKLANRWNFNIQWVNRLLLADNLEGDSAPGVSTHYNNPNNLNGTNILNNDFLSTITIGISYDFWKKQCKCLNSNK
jgi:hypothetical protein